MITKRVCLGCFHEGRAQERGVSERACLGLGAYLGEGVCLVGHVLERGCVPEGVSGIGGLFWGRGTSWGVSGRGAYPGKGHAQTDGHVRKRACLGLGNIWEKGLSCGACLGEGACPLKECVPCPGESWACLGWVCLVRGHVWERGLGVDVMGGPAQPPCLMSPHLLS